MKNSSILSSPHWKIVFLNLVGSPEAVVVGIGDLHDAKGLIKTRYPAVFFSPEPDKNSGYSAFISEGPNTVPRAVASLVLEAQEE